MPHRAIVDCDHVLLQPVLLELPGNEVAPRDVQLFFLAVPRERDDLHAIEQRRMHGPELIGRGDEEYARQIHVE